VYGGARSPNRGASDFTLQLGALRAVPRANAGEMLKLAPGILITSEGGEGHARQVFLRGFDAREGQDIEFTVGGVPINDAGNLHGNGYADTHFILPELVTALRVVEGPFDPHQGNFAVAGSADYELGLERRGLTAKYGRGSYGTERLVLLWGPPSESQRTFGGAELASTDGFGANRSARRGSAMAQYEGRLGTRGSYRLTATGYATSYQSAGVLRNDDFTSGRVGFFDSYDGWQGGDASRFSIAADLDTRSGDILLRQQLFVVDRSMRLRENFTGFLLDVQEPRQNPHAQRGDRIDLHSAGVTVGARGAARWKGTALGNPQELELGYFARGDSVDATQYRVEAATGVPYRRDTDYEAKLGNLGLYGDASLKPLGWLTLRGGVRADLFTYDVLDRCAQQSVARPSVQNPPGDASCLSQQDFGRYREPTQRSSTASTALLPRATVLFGPFRTITLSLSYGRGVRSIDPAYVTQDMATPFAAINAYEGGLSYAGTLGSVDLSARTVFFQTKVERDLIFNETVGRNVLGGGTTRTGVLGSVRATGSFFDEAANVTLVKSTFDDTKLLVPYIPDVVMRSDTALFHDIPWAVGGHKPRATLGAGVTYVGHRALPYGQRSDSIFTVDTSLGLSWSGFDLVFEASNLFDQRYRLGEYNYASDFRLAGASPSTLVPARHFSAGAPRTFFLSLAATWGGL
jgi:hypothetical protein